MKVQIKRLADGGGFASFIPIIKTPPAARASGEVSAAADDKTEKSSILDDKMIKYLYEGNGLVNDVNSLVAELVKIENSSSLPFMNNGNRDLTLQMIGKVNEISRNKQYWENAITRSKESGGLGEVAIDNYGRVFSKSSDNKIQTMSLEEYSKKRDKVKPLSVQELLYERQYNPSLTGQNGIFTVADNAIGLKKITDHVKGLVAALGKDTEESTRFYSKQQAATYLTQLTSKRPTADEQNALSLLNDIVSTPGEYIQVSTLKETEKNQINKALNYIWVTLGEPSQHKLRATAVMNGMDLREGPKRLILDMLESETDYRTKTSITPEAMPGKAEKDAADKLATTVSLTPQELFHLDRFYKPGMSYEINNPKAKVSLRATATGIGPLYNLLKPGETLGSGTMNNVLTNGNYRTLVDPAEAFIGDSRIDPVFMREVAYTGENVAKTYIPVRLDGSPDLAKMAEFDKAYQEFNKNKDNWSLADARAYFRHSGFANVSIEEIVGENGTKNKVIAESSSVKPFLALPIITNSASDLSDNPWMTKMVGVEKDAAEVMMKEAFTIETGTAAKPKVHNSMPSKTFALETPFKGVMFIAYRPEASAVISSMHGHLKGKSTSELDLHRNLNYSSNTQGPSGSFASSDLLK